MSVLTVSNLNYTYPDKTPALKDVSFQIAAKSKVAILGANGSGKSTLLQHLNGLILPQSGVVAVHGQRIGKENLADIRKMVGIVFDNPDEQLFSTLVYDDIAFGPRNLGYDEKTVAQKVEEIMTLLAITHLRDRPPYNLSLGQKKRVAIAGVLAMEPSVMVFDEPFSGLDPCTLQQFLVILDDLYHRGHTLIVTTHDVDIIYGWANEFVVLHEGYVLAQGGRELLEDKMLMAQAKLKTPDLYNIFCSTSYRPVCVDDAAECIKKIGGNAR
ncbi:MAG: ATP-binding cassette domain-containing protein [Negativicutes bacterium]|nr:ATP-binding cassette domain-containing protein [Negativicutes bacterium]